MNRTSFVSIPALPILISALLADLACSSADNQPSVNAGTTGDPAAGSSMGGNTSTGGSASGTTSTAGTPSAGGSVPSSGGSGPAGAPGTGGTTPTAGTAASGAGSGGMPATAGAGASALGGAGSGGTPAAAGSGGSDVGGAGSAGTPTAGSGGVFTFPDGTCGDTLAGEEIGKGVACTAEDVPVCDKTCGPANVGYKTETCTDATYAEGDCTFPSTANYACFALPDPLADAATCPTDAPPQHNSACSLTLCQTAAIGTACAQTTACEICGVATGYLDSGGSSKTGYCVCIMGSSGGKWACGSTTAWPCPAGNGC